jgi:hypothetical protein
MSYLNDYKTGPIMSENKYQVTLLPVFEFSGTNNLYVTLDNFIIRKRASGYAYVYGKTNKQPGSPPVPDYLYVMNYIIPLTEDDKIQACKIGLTIPDNPIPELDHVYLEGILYLAGVNGELELFLDVAVNHNIVPDKYDVIGFVESYVEEKSKGKLKIIEWCLNNGYISFEKVMELTCK